MLADTGLRVGELVRLKVPDVLSRESHHFLRVWGQGDRERLVPLTPTLYRRLGRYAERQRPDDAGSERLFLADQSLDPTLDPTFGRRLRRPRTPADVGGLPSRRFSARQPTISRRSPRHNLPVGCNLYGSVRTHTKRMEAAIAPSRTDLDHAKVADRVAFEDVLRPSLIPATRLATALLGSGDEAEDAVQEAAVRAWRKLDNLRPGADFEPWFLGIVVRQVRTLQRGRWWTVIRMPNLAPAPAGPPDGWLDGEDLRRAVSRLQRTQREAVLLHFYLDLSIDATAQALNLRPSAVKARVNRALRQLRSEVLETR